MARPQLADEGTTCNMEDGCECIEKKRSCTADKGRYSKELTFGKRKAKNLISQVHLRQWPENLFVFGATAP